ncbi:hypothetical protein CAC42_7534 [Sphaceloma murrayae]|uniref:HMG box domain-containing protein n=1 Tax=Sphaceloma murrayae TaxID=2082308 RepID=A0A2K1QXI6_9PEZI|nr:hypothetical protein CAC42_7534 [Sphaceloma murrayae]
MSTSIVSSFSGLTNEQQAIEKVWFAIVQDLAAGKDSNIISIPSAIAVQMGKDGIDAIAQRCRQVHVSPRLRRGTADDVFRAFNNSLVEVRNDEQSGGVRIEVFTTAAKKEREMARLSTAADPPQTDRSSKPPRPPNSFILYRKHHHADMVAKNPGLHNNRISQLIGSMWKAEPQAVRDQWKLKSEVVKAIHELEYPDYQYQPRKPSEKKRRMTKKKAARLASTVGAGDTKSVIDIQSPLANPEATFNDTFERATFAFDPNQGLQLQLTDDLLSGHLDNAADPATDPLSDESIFLSGVLESVSTEAQNQAAAEDYAIDNIAGVETDIFTADNELEVMLQGQIELLAGVLPQHGDSSELAPDYESSRLTTLMDYFGQVDA